MTQSVEGLSLHFTSLHQPAS